LSKALKVPTVPVPSPHRISPQSPEPDVPSEADGIESGPHRRVLRGIPDIRNFFRTNEDPVYFVGATAFNLLGLDRWVRHFYYIVYYDSWDGAHPRVFTPSNKPPVEFESGEDINNYLLSDPEVQAFIAHKGGQARVVMVFIDERTEEICLQHGYQLILPPHKLRKHLDSKITTTRLGNDAQVPSVPNVLVNVDSWDALVQVATGGGLGTDLVVQSPYGDSGKTTFFISQAVDWERHADKIVGQEVKVMQRINNRAVAVEAVVTKRGTVVGPFMTDLTGYPELTPYKGGWCGDDLYPGALSPAHKEAAFQVIRRLGDRLGQEGYRGFFEVDILVDLDTDEVYLGEINPRVSGVTSITNVTAGAYTDIPLFLFHLLEFMDVDYDFDIDEVNERWMRLAAVDVWSQLIMKETAPGVELITETPQTGTWVLDDNEELQFRRAALDWHQLEDESECFYLRVYGPGDYRFPGADIGVLVARSRMQTEDGHLTPRCRKLIAEMRKRFSSSPVLPLPPQPTFSVVKSGRA
jgi:biotin carboxylase